MITKCPCEKCGASIEFEAEQAGTDVICSQCGCGTTLRVAIPPRRIPPAASGPPTLAIASVIIVLIAALFSFALALVLIVIFLLVAILLAVSKKSQSP